MQHSKTSGNRKKCLHLSKSHSGAVRKTKNSPQKLWEGGAKRKQKARAVYPALAFGLLPEKRSRRSIQVFMENRTKEEAKEDQGMKRILNVEIKDNSSSPRSISITQLNTLLCLHLWPIKLVVCKWPYSFEMMGYLILRCTSRLDAFSVYYIRTRLPGYALGRTTDAPEVRPTRSSRTKVSSSQISNAHDR